MSENYINLCHQQNKIFRLNHLREICFWDQATNMPSKSNKSRGEALAELESIIHEININPNTKEWIKNAETENLNIIQKSNLREIKRNWLRRHYLPVSLVKNILIARSNCELNWRKQRENNDWKGFLKNFREVVKYSKEKANILSDVLCLTPYESLMDGYEQGLKEKKVDELFNDIQLWLPDLINKALLKQQSQEIIVPKGPFPINLQKELCCKVMELFGFDFNRGRLDTSIHPFCGGVPDDVRITTRFNESKFLPPLFGTIHETGHARYEQNLPEKYYGQLIGEARSMSIHESQSLFFEMQLGCHPKFIECLSPLITEKFGKQKSLSSKNLYKLITKVSPGFIRVDADEVTYPAHIIVRYEIEKKLINNQIKVDEVPELWDEKMKNLLDVDTKGNFKNGVLQDIHWPEGLFGYFPCYTLGAIYAAQWFHIISDEVDDIDQLISDKKLEPIFNWLKNNIWKKASLFSTTELVNQATNDEGLNTKYYKMHLEKRYLN